MRAFPNFEQPAGLCASATPLLPGRSPTLTRARVAHAAYVAAEGLAEALWPTRCVGCDRPGTLLCPDCAAALPAIEQRYACPDCGAPFGSLVCTECSACRDDDEGARVPGPLPSLAGEGRARAVAPPFDELDGVRCYGVHTWPLDKLVRAYKDGGERRLADVLAGMVAQAVADAGMMGADANAAAGPGRDGPPDAVTFVPCAPAAFARRGFDHMERVARAAGELLGLPVLDVLARGDARDQRGLGRRERSSNSAGAFVALQSLDGARLLLLDDVVTTGATLAASAQALRRAGAVRVAAAAVARVWN